MLNLVKLIKEIMLTIGFKPKLKLSFFSSLHPKYYMENRVFWNSMFDVFYFATPCDNWDSDFNTITKYFENFTPTKGKEYWIIQPFQDIKFVNQPAGYEQQRLKLFNVLSNLSFIMGIVWDLEGIANTFSNFSVYTEAIQMGKLFSKYAHKVLPIGINHGYGQYCMEWYRGLNEVCNVSLIDELTYHLIDFYSLTNNLKDLRNKGYKRVEFGIFPLGDNEDYLNKKHFYLTPEDLKVALTNYWLLNVEEIMIYSHNAWWKIKDIQGYEYLWYPDCQLQDTLYSIEQYYKVIREF